MTTSHQTEPHQMNTTFSPVSIIPCQTGSTEVLGFSSITTEICEIENIYLFKLYGAQ